MYTTAIYCIFINSYILIRFVNKTFLSHFTPLNFLVCVYWMGKKSYRHKTMSADIRGKKKLAINYNTPNIWIGYDSFRRYGTTHIVPYG